MRSEGTAVPADANRWVTPGTRRSVQVGALTVTYLPDGYVELHATRWFSLKPDDPFIQGATPLLRNGYLVGSIGSLLITGPDLAVLIDAGFGPRRLDATLSHPALGAMVGGQLSHERLPPLTAVAFTHLHEDHTGWLRAHGSPVQHAMMAAPRFASSAELKANGLTGQAGWNPADDGLEIAPGVTALRSAGHTHGHSSYLIESEGDSLLCFGDVMHSPLQVARPDLNSCFEADPRSSAISRQQTLELLTRPGMTGAGVHFGDVVFGAVREADGASRWLPLP